MKNILNFNKLALKEMIAIYIGLFVVYHFVPDSWHWMQAGVSDLMLANLAVITYLGFQQLRQS